MMLATKNLLVRLVGGTAIGLMMGLLLCSAAYAVVTLPTPSELIEMEEKTTCQGKMESAMRSMDPYIPRFVDPADRRQSAQYPVTTDDLLCKSPFCMHLPDHEDDELERFAYRQWNEAKACWRKQ